MGFVLLKGEKNQRYLGLEGWKLHWCRQTSFTVGCLQALVGWLSLLCLGSPLFPELGFSKPPKHGVDVGSIAP